MEYCSAIKKNRLHVAGSQKNAYCMIPLIQNPIDKATVIEFRKLEGEHGGRCRVITYKGV